MRILIVHNYYQIPGGEDTVVENERKLLEDNGHQVQLYCRHNSELNEMSLLQKLLLPFTMIFSLRTYHEIKKRIRKNKIDVVHVHNTLTLISPSVYYAASSCKVPVVQTLHNFRLLCPGATFHRGGRICEDCQKRGLKCAVRHSCYRDSKIQTLACVINLKLHRFFGIYKKIHYICLTDFNKEKLLEQNTVIRRTFNPDHIYVKPNFVNFNPEVIEFAKRNNRFVFAGRLDKLKGIKLLLKAWKLLEEESDGNDIPELLICGTGPEEAWCKKFITDEELKQVHLMGFVPNDELIKILSDSKALILPTQWYEGFPMSIVESMACGTPIIGSNIGNVNSLIEADVNGLKFQFDSEDSLKNSILNLTDMVDSTKDKFRKEFHPKTNYDQLMEIYNRCKILS